MITQDKMQPTLTNEQMLEFKNINDEIDRLYERRTTLLKQVLSGTNHLQSYMTVDAEKPFMRVTCTDNLNVFNSFDSVHRVSTIHRYEVKIEFLKNEPKEK